MKKFFAMFLVGFPSPVFTRNQRFSSDNVVVQKITRLTSAYGARKNVSSGVTFLAVLMLLSFCATSAEAAPTPKKEAKKQEPIKPKTVKAPPSAPKQEKPKPKVAAK